MKKSLGCVIVLAAVMSASVCAMPAPENTETADEFYGQTGIVLYEDDGIDYDAPDYGVKVISTGFEEMTAGKAVDTTFFNNAGVEIRTQGDGIAANFTDKEIGGITGNKIEGVIAENADKYACVRFFLLPKDSEITYGAGKYYIFSDIYLDGDCPENGTVSAYFYRKDRATASQTSFDFANASLFKSNTNQWNTFELSFDVPNGELTDIGTYMIAFIDMQNTTVYTDNVKIYYQPSDTAEYEYAVDYSDMSNPVLAISSADGFEENAAKALCAAPARYFGENVTSVNFGYDNTVMKIYFKPGTQSVTVPALVNAAGNATYPEKIINTEADINTLYYGLKNYYWTAESETTYNVTAYEKALADVGHTFETDSEVGKYVKLDYTNADMNIGLTYTRDLNIPYNLDYTYTYITKMKADSDIENFKSFWLTLRSYSGGGTSYGQALANHTWSEVKFEYVLNSESEVSSAAKRSQAPDIYFGTKPSVLNVAYVGLYYKPVKAAAAPAVTSAGNTVTVTYSEGIDEDQTVALKAYYTKYFGGDVAALTVNGNDVAVTLADGVESVTMPALVNKNGSATYQAVTVYAKLDLSPVTLNEKELRLTNTNSGLRFKAYVLHENLESLDEYGYIVALEKTLTDNRKTHEDLTFDLDKNTVKYVSEAAYVRGRDKNYIFNNNYEVNGSTANLFTGVLTGIPKGKYDLTLVARPYAKSKGTYYYGEPISGNVQAVALEIKNSGRYDSLKAEQQAIVDDFAENKAE